MANTGELSYKLVQDEPWVFLDVRKNPVNGRKLTYQLSDGTYLELDASMQEYANPTVLKPRLQALIKAHSDVAGL